MSMREHEELFDRMCDELEEIAHEIKNKPNALNMSDLDKIHKIVDTAYKLFKMDRLSEEGYSQLDGRDMRGYGDGNSYANRGEHWVRGHFSRDDGRSAARRDDRGRYSRDGGREHMLEQLREMKEDATTERQRSAINRCIEQLENE